MGLFPVSLFSSGSCPRNSLRFVFNDLIAAPTYLTG